MKIIFVCHGSICRSPAAEYIFKMLSSEHEVISRALSHEEIGNDIYPPMKSELRRNNIPFAIHHATYLTDKEFNECDYLFYMDKSNYRLLHYRFGDNDKMKPISIFTNDIDEIEDPWYTDNYQKVVNQIYKCIKDIIKNISI